MIDRSAEIVALLQERLGSDAACAAAADHYSCVSVVADDHKVAAAARICQATWYATEVRNVAVRADLQGKGWGRKLLVAVERKALQRDCRVVMATVRESNFASKCLFYGAGYRCVARFLSNISDKPMGLWVKSIV